MPPFAGVSHVALQVADLDVSRRFYVEVLDFVLVLDMGTACVCRHTPTGLTISLIQDRPWTVERPATDTGLAHIGIAVAGQDDLVAWERRLASAGVSFTPIQDMPRGYYLRLRDPDGFPWELQAPNTIYAAAVQELRRRDVADSDLLVLSEDLVAPQFDVHLD